MAYGADALPSSAGDLDISPLNIAYRHLDFAAGRPLAKIPLQDEKPFRRQPAEESSLGWKPLPVIIQGRASARLRRARAIFR